MAGGDSAYGGTSQRVRGWRNVYESTFIILTQTILHLQAAVGWVRSVGALKLQVSFAKEPDERDDILQKRPIILRSLLIVATPCPVFEADNCIFKQKSFEILVSRRSLFLCVCFLTHGCDTCFWIYATKPKIKYSFVFLFICSVFSVLILRPIFLFAMAAQGHCNTMTVSWLALTIS